MNGIKSEYEEGLPLDIQMNGRTEPLASIMPVETRKSVWVVHIEVRLKPTSSALVDLVRKHVKQHISSDETLLLPSIITGWEVQSLLYQNVELIRASESTCPHSSLPLDQAELEIHVYQPNDTDVFEEFSTTGKGDGDDMMAASVVNALLTQLDKLKHRKNVLVMTTSNLADAIDTAFIDRADIVQYVGLPPQEGIYWILQSCIAELIRAQIVSPVDLVDPKTLQFANNIKVEFGEEDQSRVASKRLWELAGQCIGMSGRSLRRLPVLAHARHIGASAMGGRASDISVWLDAMTKVVADERNGRLFNGKGGAGNSA
ncbi:hypothetical protein FRB98_000089 [Tulasnella sp. 332]|nr:hypothetical protein FRB98_000089 [Tulasnella sp. 332]